MPAIAGTVLTIGDYPALSFDHFQSRMKTLISEGLSDSGEPIAYISVHPPSQFQTLQNIIDCAALGVSRSESLGAGEVYLLMEQMNIHRLDLFESPRLSNPK